MTEQRTIQQKGCYSRSNIVHSDKIYVDVHSSHDKVILGCREISIASLHQARQGTDFKYVIQIR